ncbi:AgmX/PglI C-terminal domain-containing protein [uncultured Fibrobacter sp.]|uniref:AgmX/PglI C-terminal domain-containing protein n=1 Tax=uncultured Fibrobacter sp. TaxID=261512 RepID=UPI0025E9E639|nr:AgmX/PglI C-terminal domain-containing protein [uncultured Fibrobacter sp.]
MAKLFSKCLGKIVLMTAAALWAGCSDSEKSDGAAKQDNPKLVHPWDTKKFFDEKPDGNLLEKREKRRLDSLRDTGRLIDSGVTALYGVYVADSMVFANESAKAPPNSRGLAEFPDREKIQVVEESPLDKESVFNVLASFTPGLRHIYSIRYLLKNPDKHFEGEITFKLTISADGSVKEIQIVSSTTGYKEFDEDIQKAVCRWKFPKVKSGETIVTFPITFHENPAEIKTSQSE